MADPIMLEENVDPDYEPTKQEILEYAEWLGMDKDVDQDLFWIARKGLKAPLPAGWKPCRTGEPEGELFYFNLETGESVWDHPWDEYHRQLFHQKKEESAQQLVGTLSAALEDSCTLNVVVTSIAGDMLWGWKDADAETTAAELQKSCEKELNQQVRLMLPDGKLLKEFDKKTRIAELLGIHVPERQQKKSIDSSDSTNPINEEAVDILNEAKQAELDERVGDFNASTAQDKEEFLVESPSADHKGSQGTGTFIKFPVVGKNGRGNPEAFNATLDVSVIQHASKSTTLSSADVELQGLGDRATVTRRKRPFQRRGKANAFPAKALPFAEAARVAASVKDLIASSTDASQKLARCGIEALHGRQICEAKTRGAIRTQVRNDDPHAVQRTSLQAPQGQTSLHRYYQIKIEPFPGSASPSAASSQGAKSYNRFANPKSVIDGITRDATHPVAAQAAVRATLGAGAPERRRPHLGRVETADFERELSAQMAKIEMGNSQQEIKYITSASSNLTPPLPKSEQKTEHEATACHQPTLQRLNSDAFDQKMQKELNAAGLGLTPEKPELLPTQRPMLARLSTDVFQQEMQKEFAAAGLCSMPDKTDLLQDPLKADQAIYISPPNLPVGNVRLFSSCSSELQKAAVDDGQLVAEPSRSLKERGPQDDAHETLNSDRRLGICRAFGSSIDSDCRMDLEETFGAHHSAEKGNLLEVSLNVKPRPSRRLSPRPTTTASTGPSIGCDVSPLHKYNNSNSRERLELLEVPLDVKPKSGRRLSPRPSSGRSVASSGACDESTAQDEPRSISKQEGGLREEMQMLQDVLNRISSVEMSMAGFVANARHDFWRGVLTGGALIAVAWIATHTIAKSRR